MYAELAEFYRQKIFSCTRCSQKLMNPYFHINLKRDPGGKSLAANRQKFQLDYIASKRDIKLIVVGEAPGLDGCGYGGIAFTGEYNAVHDLGLANHHGTVEGWQKEQSANLLYLALKEYCRQEKINLVDAASHMYFTNAVLCVPLGTNGRSITSPTQATKQECSSNLVTQIEILRPNLILTLGANALRAVAAIYGLTVKDKLVGLVKRQSKEGPLPLSDGLSLRAEIHPSPRNRVLGDLYTGLPSRLAKIFASVIP